MSSTCFETKGSSSGRRFYIQCVLHAGITIHLWSFHHVKHTIHHLYI